MSIIQTLREGIMPEEKGKLSISKLTYQEKGNFAGNYAILINGSVFGYINAQTKAQFNLTDGRVLEKGTHTVDYQGRRLKVDVKDIAPDTTFFDLARIEPEYREQMRLAKRPVGAFELQEIKTRIASAKAHNDATMKEILERVVVTEA